MNYKLILEYDGTDFSGFQIQPRQRTVQGEMQRALDRLFPEGYCLAAAGRTDAGVHALGQVVNIRAEKAFAPETLQKALNANLPGDIVVKQAEIVAPDFHARFSACRRSYEYRLITEPTALFRRFVWAISFVPDGKILRQCAEIVKANENFESFTKTGAEVRHFLCAVEESRWEQDGPNFVYHISANRFLHNMVRILVGTMLEVARGRFSVADFEKMFRARDRKAAGLTAPARGLLLVRVDYSC
ncbi:MAG: tRNA pseudouridine(38-40) synthase TruA [Calditrichaeota bacterium]|nr:tRNA pseudouridine(38-40) synthase TruA [Calditrichota bacterium]